MQRNKDVFRNRLYAIALVPALFFLGYGANLASLSKAAEETAYAPVSLSKMSAPAQSTLNGFTLTGDPESDTGATWTYKDRIDGVDYDLAGVLFKPSGAGPFPGVILSHGMGGNARGYSTRVAREMKSWGLVCIGTNYTHAAGVPLGSPGTASEVGASNANVLRARRCWDILASLGYVDMQRVAAHGHSMGAFVTAALVGTYPNNFRVASHTAGGVHNQKNASTKESQASGIIAPYQMHHGDQDQAVPLEDDQRLDALLEAKGTPHQLHVYPGYDHNQITFDATMFQRVEDWYTAHGLFGSTSNEPIDVGLLILGHSTSAQGDWPGKLAQSLNADPNRNYVVFRVITGGDGGFLWTQPSFQPNDPQYDRVRSSQGQQQWCQDSAGVRWSCRRARLEEAMTGVKPPSCFSGSACSPPQNITLTWHEGGVAQTGTLSFYEAWKKMDLRIALIQDTSNRSWPIDDFNGDGVVDNKDFWPESRIAAAARPCGGTGGVVADAGGARFIDWNCDGQLSQADAAANRYADWLEKLSLDLLNNFPPESRAHHVFITQKPLELICNPALFPSETCRNHLPLRAPTLSRPYDHYFLPTVYWEYRVIETLFARNNLDPRIHKITADARRMWDRSVQGYTQGIKADDWTIPATAGRPAADIAADDTENDASGGDAQSVGTLNADHIHHNDNGGWMMADVWYAGLLSFFEGGSASSPLLTASQVLKKGKPVDHLVAGIKAKKYQIVLAGSGFTSESRALIDGAEAETSLTSSNELAVRLPFKRVPDVDVITVQVRNIDGQVSNSVNVEVRRE